MTSQEPKKIKLTFCGGTGMVTGSNFLVEYENFKILVDCGMIQGNKFCSEENKSPFLYDPSTVNVLLITHSHIDHIGRIPKLVKDGFKGVIYSTPETKEISEPMLLDSLKLLSSEAELDNTEPLYSKQDVEKSFEIWETIPYHTEMDIGGDFKVFLKDSGHVLGSSIIELHFNGKKIVFTGDLGNSPSPLLKDTEDIYDADYLIMESVYGDRNHEAINERKERLEDVIEDAAKRGGALLIPAFSLEKTQVIIYEINNLVEQARIPRIPVFIDSPLAMKITEIYKKRIQDFNEQTQKEIASGDNIFAFPGLYFTSGADDSKAIKNVPNPKIIIAGSGMSSGGRIIHHEMNYLSDPNSTILFVGYQSVGSLGRQIEEGAKKVRIAGKDFEVQAHIEKISGYSCHKDFTGLFKFVENTVDTIKKVFVVMGEPKSSMYLVQRLRDYLGVDAVMPKEGESVILDI
ncbi:MAG: MBL fold metallo-hydrolase [Candidatus Paceibacterota bacterium]